MMQKFLDVANHVRYVVALTRAGGDGQRYVAMKTSIEIAEAEDEAIVQDRLVRALKREMPHEENLDLLTESVTMLVWSWLTLLREGIFTHSAKEGSVILVPSNYMWLGGEENVLEVDVFTKEDEKRVYDLLLKLRQ